MGECWSWVGEEVAVEFGGEGSVEISAGRPATASRLTAAREQKILGEDGEAVLVGGDVVDGVGSDFGCVDHHGRTNEMKDEGAT
jgi:hypothetical protein